MFEQHNAGTFASNNYRILYHSHVKRNRMITNIKVTISKEDRFNIQELVNEITNHPKSAYDLCELYGCEGFTLDEFKDFDSLTKEAKDRLIEDFAISKSEADAELTDSLEEKSDYVAEYFEGED
jgi:hypothetical protein